MSAPGSVAVRPGRRLGPLTPMARKLRDVERQATRRWRRLPDFLIIGAQKSGTTSLLDYVGRHPRVAPAIAKGIHFYDGHYARGLDWYRSRFPVRGPGRIAGEATPAYLFYPFVSERVARDLPDARLIVVLRNPVERAHSHYHHERAQGAEPLSFADALAAEDERLVGEAERVLADERYVSFPLLHWSYRSRGLYAGQLARWLDVVPRDRLLVLQAERLFADPAAVLAEAFEFLDLPPFTVEHYPVRNAGSYEAIDPDVRASLSRFYREPNERLYELIETRFDWS